MADPVTPAAWKCLCLTSLCGVVMMTLLLGSLVGAADNPHYKQKLMVWLLDGFRWDYVDKFDLPNFKRMWTLGAKADYMQNDWPTLSYPNYYTLMTGKHTEDHAMTGNYMYDPVTQKYFIIGTNEDQFLPLWWDAGEPLWVTAVKQGKSSYMYYWPGCEVTIQGHDPTFCDAYSRVPTLQDVNQAIDDGFQLLTNGTADLVGIYSEQPDYVGHKYGPDHSSTKATLEGLDIVLGEALDRLSALSDEDKFNLIIFSDHGMTSIDPSRVINITGPLRSESGLFTTIQDKGAMTSIYVPDQVAEDKVYNLLKDLSPHMKVYRKSSIPDRYYYKNGPYVSRITCEADLGWTIVQPLSPEFPTKGTQNMGGHHGFDNREADMRGIFYAVGPYFLAGSRVDHIQAIDPYNLMCSILDLTAAENSGSLSVFEPLLFVSAGVRVTFSVLHLLISSSAIGLFVIHR